MSRIISARDHLERANGLAAVLAAAYDVFEGMRLAFRTCEDPATGLFAAFVMASASAADGRDAVAFAPSLPLRRVHEKPGAGEEPHEGLQQGGHCWLAADVSQVLADRLFQAAALP